MSVEKSSEKAAREWGAQLYTYMSATFLEQWPEDHVYHGKQFCPANLKSKLKELGLTIKKKEEYSDDQPFGEFPLPMVYPAWMGEGPHCEELMIPLRRAQKDAIIEAFGMKTKSDDD